MMNGEIWWVDFQEPRGSTPAFVRPGIIVVDKQALLEKVSHLPAELYSEIYDEINWVLEH